LRQLDREAVGVGAMTIEKRRKDALAYPGLLLASLGWLAAMVLLLACAGIYVFVGYSVAK
jgi:hypothetical protein